jgi:probable HAF family extracellular repeat protein
MKKFLTLFASAFFSLAISQGASATSYTTTTIEHPGSIYTYAGSVNDYGIVAGFYHTDEHYNWGPSGSSILSRGYVFDGANFMDFSIPNVSTFLTGINNNGDLIGYYHTQNDSYHAFLYSSGTLTSLDFPGAKDNFVSDINNSGQVLGSYSIDGITVKQYIYDSGHFTILDAQFPGAESTGFAGLNDNGDLVGSYSLANSDSSYNSHGFIYSNGDFIPVDHPGDPNFTSLSDINNQGQALGMYMAGGIPEGTFGFLYKEGEFFSLPWLSDDQSFVGINNNGQIAGSYLGMFEGADNYGFLLTPKKAVATPEPSSMFLVGAALAGIFVARRFNRTAL